MIKQKAKAKNQRKAENQANDTRYNEDALGYGIQVALMSIGTILGIITVLALVLIIFFED